MDSRRCRAISRRETLTTFGCTGCRIEVIPNFIDPDVYDRSRYTPMLARAGRRRTHGADARLELPAGEARARRRRHLRARREARFRRVLVMVGDGPDRVDAEAEARELGVQDKVFFLGKIDAVAPLLAGADLFLLPSSSESFGLSALEALASRRAGRSARTPADCPRSCATARPASSVAVGDVEGMADAGARDPARSRPLAGNEHARRGRRARAVLARRDRRRVRGVLRVHAGAAVDHRARPDDRHSDSRFEFT